MLDTLPDDVLRLVAMHARMTPLATLCHGVSLQWRDVAARKLQRAYRHMQPLLGPFAVGERVSVWERSTGRRVIREGTLMQIADQKMVYRRIGHHTQHIFFVDNAHRLRRVVLRRVTLPSPSSRSCHRRRT